MLPWATCPYRVGSTSSNSWTRIPQGTLSWSSVSVSYSPSWCLMVRTGRGGTGGGGTGRGYGEGYGQGVGNRANTKILYSPPAFCTNKSFSVYCRSDSKCVQTKLMVHLGLLVRVPQIFCSDLGRSSTDLCKCSVMLIVYLWLHICRLRNEYNILSC